MLPRKLLIPLKSEFPRLMKISRSIETPSLRLLWSRVAVSKNPTTYAFIISKKVSLSSVVRHNVKRKLAAAFEQLKCPAGWKIIVLAKSPIVTLSIDDLVLEIRSLLRRAQILE